MLTHLVFFRFKDAEGRSADENAAHAKAMLEALPAQIPELQSLSCGHDVSRTPASFDLGLSTTFVDAEALEIYRVHPAHQEVIAFIKATTSDRAVVDYLSD